MQSEVNQEENLNRIITVPNLLSFFRLCLIPVIIWSYCVKKNPLLAGEILLLSGLTDLADGYIARRFHRISNLGKILDPVADKLTQAAMLICLFTRFPHVLLLIVIMAGMVNPKQAVLFIIVFLLLQQIEGNLIYPHVVGGSVGLPSIWVLAAVTIGGNLMGIIGMLIFIPLVSVFYTIFREFVYLRLKKQHIKRVTRTDVEEYAEEGIASSFIVPNEK